VIEGSDAIRRLETAGVRHIDRSRWTADVKVQRLANNPRLLSDDAFLGIAEAA
jgi:hypothetical protein